MRILGYNYRVIRDGLADDIGALGRCHTARQRIQIAEDIAPEQVVSTVLHEALEALRYHLGLEFDHGTVMALEAGLYQFLTDAGVDLSPLSAHLEEVTDPGPAVRPIEYIAATDHGPAMSVSCYHLGAPGDIAVTVSGESGGISAGVGE